MSEKHRKQLAETAYDIASEVERLAEMDETERLFFWREFFQLRDLLADIEHEFPQYDDRGSAA